MIKNLSQEPILASGEVFCWLYTRDCQGHICALAMTTGNDSAAWRTSDARPYEYVRHLSCSMKNPGVREIAHPGLRLCVIAVGVFALPVPRVPAHIGKALFCLPAEDLRALSGICIAGGNVAGATVYDLIGEI